MTTIGCTHVWVAVLGGGLQCQLCEEVIEKISSGICPITSCHRPIDDHWGVKGLDHPICPGDLPLPPPIGPKHRERRK